jgi:hypothetical protein
VPALLVALTTASLGLCQPDPDLQRFFRQDIGLSQDQITAIQSGNPVALSLPSRTPDEVFLFGVIYIHAAPEKYLQYADDFNRFRKLSGCIALGVFENPPQLSDLKGFEFDEDEIRDLKNCAPGDCLFQMPASTIEEFHQSIDWSAPDVDERVNQSLQKLALAHLLLYQEEGNQTLGVYNDRRDPQAVAQQFAYLLSYSRALPEYLPDFYYYLLAYPKAKPPNVEDRFYWTKVKFGLRPTLRVIHRAVLRGKPTDNLAYAIAEKQLYSSHYFRTALNLSLCIRGTDGLRRPGFYLIMVMGSEQVGLNGIKGSMIRKVAVGRSVSDLQTILVKTKNELEALQ